MEPSGALDRPNIMGIQRVLRAAVLVGVVTLALTGCRAGADVFEVRQTDDPTVLEVVVDTCNADLDTTITESADEVVIDVDNNDRDVPWAGQDDCQDSVTVELEQPLGDRTVTLDDGNPVRLLPFPTPTAVSNETAVGPIEFCGSSDPPQPEPGWSDARVRQHSENADLASLASQPYRSDPAWRGMSGRVDDDGDLVFVFRFATVTPELEADIGNVMGDVPFEVAPPTYSDDELRAAEHRLQDSIDNSEPGLVSGVGGSSNPDFPGRIVVYMADPADGASLSGRLGLEPPYGPYCIWPNPAPSSDADS